MKYMLFPFTLCVPFKKNKISKLREQNEPTEYNDFIDEGKIADIKNQQAVERFVIIYIFLLLICYYNVYLFSVILPK